MITEQFPLEMFPLNIQHIDSPLLQMKCLFFLPRTLQGNFKPLISPLHATLDWVPVRHYQHCSLEWIPVDSFPVLKVCCAAFGSLFEILCVGAAPHINTLVADGVFDRSAVQSPTIFSLQLNKTEKKARTFWEQELGNVWHLAWIITCISKKLQVTLKSTD